MLERLVDFALRNRLLVCIADLAALRHPIPILIKVNELGITSRQARLAE